MSALRTAPPLDAIADLELHETITYEFDQPIAIPSYLIAIAGGEFSFAVSLFHLHKIKQVFTLRLTAAFGRKNRGLG